jgi:hypothetical protein
VDRLDVSACCVTVTTFVETFEEEAVVLSSASRSQALVNRSTSVNTGMTKFWFFIG